MPPRIKVAKTEPVQDSTEDNLAEVLEDIAAVEAAVTSEVDPAAVTHKRFARIAYYSAALSMVLVIVFAWLSSYYVIALETRLSETTSTMLAQLDGRIASLEEAARPAVERPKFVQFTPPEGAPRLGDANAKVTIVEFADFQCPFCGRFQQSVYPQIKSEYIDTGKATLVYQDFAFLGEESTVAAEAAKCAGDQGKFWEYHDYLFTHQKGENQGAFVARNLKAFARLLKLDVAKFNACLDSGQKKQAVEDETTAGKNIGVTGTPTIIVNGKVFVGALPFDTFKQAIDEAFAK